MINSPIPKWANKTLMELAAISRSKEFIGHPRCKEISDEKWRGDILLASDDEHLNRKVCFFILSF